MSVDPLNSLPVVPDAVLPADVRNGTTQDKQAYTAALGFERQLLTQLTQAMVDSTQQDQDSSDDSDSTDDGSDAVTQAYNQMLPDQLADGLIAAGGTGLAENLYRALRQEQS